MSIDYPFLIGVGGSDTSKRESSIAADGYCKGANIEIVDGIPTTRRGFRVWKLTANSKFEKGNVQGATFFDPSLGQSSVSFSDSRPMIVVAVAGKKFKIDVNTKELSEIVSAKDAIATTDLVVFCQAENYLIAVDSKSDTWVWDSMGDPEFSPGYSEENKEASRIPNSAYAVAYSHGRLVVALNGNMIVVGDSIHKNNKSNASNLLEFTEQAYWATGASFAPPTSLGNTTAISILPIRDTQHGHGEVMVHLDLGIFSIDTNVYPRSKWSETPMVKTASMESSAVGPYAICVSSGDQIFRSHSGIETLRSSTGATGYLFSPSIPATERVNKLFDADYKPLLRFASVVRVHRDNKVLSTVSPNKNGLVRWHDGIASINSNSSPGDGNPTVAFEGTWCLPNQVKGIVQLVSFVSNGDGRVLAVCNNADPNNTVNRIGEFEKNLTYDVLEDGTIKQIECAVVTRGSFFESSMGFKNLKAVKVFFRNITGSLNWSVYYRTSENANWTKIKDGSLRGGSGGVCLDGSPNDMPLSTGIVLSVSEVKFVWIQFLIKWTGYAQLNGVMADADVSESSTNFEESFSSQGKFNGTLFNPYEYSEKP